MNRVRRLISSCFSIREVLKDADIQVGNARGISRMTTNARPHEMSSNVPTRKARVFTCS